MAQHFVLYKPAGYLSQFVGEGRRKMRLGELHAFPEGTMAIGRLDEASEGVLLLTTDGAVSAHVRSAAVEKEYWAQVDGEITAEAVAALAAGVVIATETGPYRTQPGRAWRLPAEPTLPAGRRIRDARHGPTSWVALILTEGRFRQVRRMTAAVGFPTLRLVRVRVGGETLAGLQPGEVRHVAAFRLTSSAT